MGKALFFIYLIWGFNWVVLNVANSYFSPLTFVTYRYVPPFCERHRYGMKRFFRSCVRFCYTGSVELAYYRTRGGEWRGCIAATPASLYGVGCP